MIASDDLGFVTGPLLQYHSALCHPNPWFSAPLTTGQWPSRAERTTGPGAIKGPGRDSTPQPPAPTRHVPKVAAGGRNGRPWNEQVAATLGRMGSGGELRRVGQTRRGRPPRIRRWMVDRRAECLLDVGMDMGCLGRGVARGRAPSAGGDDG